jgi:hypothetical protein
MDSHFITLCAYLVFSREESEPYWNKAASNRIFVLLGVQHKRIWKHELYMSQTKQSIKHWFFIRFTKVAAKLALHGECQRQTLQKQLHFNRIGTTRRETHVCFMYNLTLVYHWPLGPKIKPTNRSIHQRRPLMSIRFFFKTNLKMTKTNSAMASSTHNEMILQFFPAPLNWHPLGTSGVANHSICVGMVHTLVRCGTRSPPSYVLFRACAKFIDRVCAAHVILRDRSCSCTTACNALVALITEAGARKTHKDTDNFLVTVVNC